MNGTAQFAIVYAKQTNGNGWCDSLSAQLTDFTVQPNSLFSRTFVKADSNNDEDYCKDEEKRYDHRNCYHPSRCYMNTHAPSDISHR